MKKRILSALLTAVMACTLLCIPAGAAGKTQTFSGEGPDDAQVTVTDIQRVETRTYQMLGRFNADTWEVEDVKYSQEMTIYVVGDNCNITFSGGRDATVVTYNWEEEGQGLVPDGEEDKTLSSSESWSFAYEPGKSPILDDSFHIKGWEPHRELRSYNGIFVSTEAELEKMPGIQGGPSDWAKEIVKQAEDAGLVCFSAAGIYQEKITRLQFAQLAVTLMERQAGDLEAGAAGAFTDTSDPLVLKAAKLGVVSGKGDGKFAPNAPVSRQEICVMLSKTMEYLEDNRDTVVIDDHSTEIDTSRFNDVDTVAPWARDAVAMLTNNGIMNGLDGGIAPHANTTVEQAIIMIWAVFNKG